MTASAPAVMVATNSGSGESAMRVAGPGLERLRTNSFGGGRCPGPAEKRNSLVDTDVVQGADVRMIEAGDDRRFAIEAVTPLGIGREIRRQELDRDGAAEAGVDCPVHFAHATGGNQGLNCRPLRRVLQTGARRRR